MQQPRKIVVFRPLGEELAGMLRRLSPQPDVRIMDNIYAAAPAVLEFRPQLAFLAGVTVLESDLGALRLLRAALGELFYLLVTPASREVERSDLARRLPARILVEPIQLRQLSAVVQDPGMTAEPSNPEYFLDLARGLCDTINNPLMFATGHLQLLELRLPEDPDQEQIQAIKRALKEISDSMEKVRVLGESGLGRRALLLRALLYEALAALGADLEIEAPAEFDRVAIWGNREQLVSAFRELLAMAMELGDGRSIHLRHQGMIVEVELRLRGDFARQWQLSRSFEPYYLARIFRGSKHGLALFLVQTIVHAHGGTATATKPDAHSIALVLTLSQA